MFTVHVGTFLCLLGFASALAVNRSTIEPDHNWKFQFPVKASTSYVESTTEIPMDLNQFTISFWVDDVTDNYIAYFSTPGRELELYNDYVYSSRRRLRLFVNGVEKFCDNCLSPGSRKHIVVTWSGTADANGVGSIWVNGASVFSFSGLSAGSVIEKGLRLKLGQRHDSSSTYSFRGEIMYFNLYPTYVTTADHVAKLSKKATIDSEAVLSWGSFIGGANGDVVIYPELEIFTQSYIAVTCHSSNMTLTLDRSAFPHLIPSRASLKDPSCKVVADDNFINVTTNWASCGTVVTYNESMAYYTNYIVPDILNPPDHTSDSEETVHAVINRGSIALDESRLFLTCKYDLVPHSSIAAYAVSSSTYSVKGKGARDFSFGIKLYHDSSYETVYREAEYPLHADSKERVFAQAQLSSSGEDRISIRVEKCVMTPDSDPDYSTHHNLLADGCAADDTVQYHDAPNSLAQRFSFEVFRFNERPTAVVFMHCYIDVCPSDDEDSKCKSGWTSCATESESESEGDAK